MSTTMPTNAHCCLTVIRSPRIGRAARRSPAAGSCAEKIALPATNVSAPARQQSPIVSRAIPPSTSSAAPLRAASSNRPRSSNLIEHRADERLPAETWIYRHHQQKVQITGDLAHHLEWRRRVQRDARPAAELLDPIELTMEMRRNLGVNREPARAGPREILEVLLRLDDHQVHVESAAPSVVAPSR